MYTPKIFWWHRFYYILLLHRQSNIIYILSLTYLDIWYYSIKSALNNFFCVEGKDTKSLMIPSATEIISLNIQSDIISSLGMDNINTLEKSLIKCQLILILKGDIDKKDRAFFWVALRGKKKNMTYVQNAWMGITGVGYPCTRITSYTCVGITPYPCNGD